MNGASLNKLLVLTAGLAALAGCSAEASMPPDPNDGDNKGTGGSKGLIPGAAGSTGNGTAGSAAPSGSGGTTAPSGSGGTAASTAGASSTAGSATVGGSAPTGTAGGGALAACPSPPAAGALADALIDDLEDKDNGVSKVGGRSGYWYTYLDTFGSTIVPKPDSTGAAPLLPGSTDCHGGTACIMISGTTTAADEATMKYPYAGVGFDFSNAKKPCVYNGGAYTGIKFWARGDVEITIKVNVSGTADAKGGGTCTTGCSNGHGKKVVLTPTWAEVDLPFAAIMQDPSWGTQVPFDKAALLSLQVQVPSGGAFSVALDDFTFY